MQQGGIIRIPIGIFLLFFSVVGQSIGDSHITKEHNLPSALKIDKPTAVQVEIETLSGYAEDIYDLAKVNKWNKIGKKLIELKKSEKSLNLIRNEENDFYSQRLRKKIEDLEQAISAKNRRETMQISNNITLLEVAVMGQFKLRVPTDVMVLDYCGRELEILSEEKDIERLFNLVVRMHLIWQNLIPQLIQKGATKEIKNFSEIMKRLEIAKTPEEFNRLAKQVLDEVDNLEKVFKK
jgi:hypothetical protein